MFRKLVVLVEPDVPIEVGIALGLATAERLGRLGFAGLLEDLRQSYKRSRLTGHDRIELLQKPAFGHGIAELSGKPGAQSQNLRLVQHPSWHMPEGFLRPLELSSRDGPFEPQIPDHGIVGPAIST